MISALITYASNAPSVTGTASSLAGQAGKVDQLSRELLAIASDVYREAKSTSSLDEMETWLIEAGGRDDVASIRRQLVPQWQREVARSTHTEQMAESCSKVSSLVYRFAGTSLQDQANAAMAPLFVLIETQIVAAERMKGHPGPLPDIAEAFDVAIASMWNIDTPLTVSRGWMGMLGLDGATLLMVAAVRDENTLPKRKRAWVLRCLQMFTEWLLRAIDWESPRDLQLRLPEKYRVTAADREADQRQVDQFKQLVANAPDINDVPLCEE